LKYDMIHGSLSLKQRQKVLKDYKSPMGPNILLMTLGTGAEGLVHTSKGTIASADTHRLNLTVATHIYMLEPQWNPFVELQAMARAQRIGQTRQVVCVRYVMEKTIEQVRVTQLRSVWMMTHIMTERHIESSENKDKTCRGRFQEPGHSRLIGETVHATSARGHVNSRQQFFGVDTTRMHNDAPT
jgi:hypothetical protein